MSFWEILFITVMAVYVGMWYYHLVPDRSFIPLYRTTFFIILIATPIVIATSIHKSHVSVGFGDESLRTVPIGPLQIMLPRISAVALTWLQIVGPVLVIFLLNVDRFGMSNLWVEKTQWFQLARPR